MIMPMRAGRNVKRKLKRRGKVLKMPLEVVNICMSRWLFNVWSNNIFVGAIVDLKFYFGE